MEAINLTEEQRLYLQHIFEYFRKNSQWPTHQYLDGVIDRERPDLDIVQIWKSLPQGLTNSMDLNWPDSKATLTVPAIYLLEKNAPELATFLKVLKIFVDNYRPSSENWVSSETIVRDHPTWRPNGIHRSGLLLLIEPGMWQSFSEPDQAGNWGGRPHRLIRRFRGITTIEEYLEKRNPYPKAASTPSIPEASSIDTSITVECILHPDIHEKCWELYTNGDYDNAILNATKAIEVAVRKKSGLPDHLVGTAIMGQAFGSDNPKLLYSAVKSEQDGMMSLLKGIIGVYKNPQSHRFVGIEDKSECLGIMLICSSLLYTIDNTSVAQSVTSL
jgi:uncharacterized protein (TIGR02391 family)